MNGGLGRIRTPDPLVRSQVLYPTELPVRAEKRGVNTETSTALQAPLAEKIRFLRVSFKRRRMKFCRPRKPRAQSPVPVYQLRALRGGQD